MFLFFCFSLAFSFLFFFTIEMQTGNASHCIGHIVNIERENHRETRAKCNHVIKTIDYYYFHGSNARAGDLNEERAR